ncbi:hypothetical protein Lal_00012747 [Lupinus albus]|nr:hypothetical protein Lal_00012747 [Lupinus albus]
MGGQNPYHEGRSKFHTTKKCQNPYQEGRSKSIPRWQGFLLLSPLAFSVLLLPPWKARGLVLNSFASIKFGAAAGDNRFIQRRNTYILHSINPEIDRIYHRLVRQNRTLDTNFVSVSEHPVVENTTYEHSISVHSKYSDSVHSAAFPNFDHYVHSENMAQPPTPPGPHERTLRELAAPDFTYDSLCIQYEDYFYEGLNNMDRSIIDAASGGALGDMTHFEARSLIEKMASNSQQFNARSGDAIVVRGVHDVGTNAARQDKLETKIDSLTTLITHDMCPSLLEPRTGDHPEAYAANINNNKPPHQQQHYDPPSSSTYNPGWRNQAPFQNNNVGHNRSSYVPPPIQQQRHQMINTPAPTEPSLEELVSFCIDEFLIIDIDVPCNSFYTCHACTDSELCDSCIDEFLNIVVDSPVTHSHCTNTIAAGIRQQYDLFVQVQATTKPSFATFFPSVLKAPDWTPPFDLQCDIVVYALGTVPASYEFDFLLP